MRNTQASARSSTWRNSRRGVPLPHSGTVVSPFRRASWNLRIIAGRDVAGFEIEVVARPVQVGGHGGDEPAAELLAVRLAELDAGNLGDGVRLVGRFELTGEQGALGHRLFGEPGVDTARPEVQQLVDVVVVGRLDDRGVDHQVVVDELCRSGAVGVDPTDGAGHEEHMVGAVGPEPIVDGGPGRADRAARDRR